jgi:nitroimidazol reductase NimA-like FMN-containing flavoprotein (pyridoxamine 5'-phosphate oxidase superfamily)
MELNKPAEKRHKEQTCASGKGIPATTRRGRVSVPARLRSLDRTQRHAVLATVSLSGPHTSLIAFALTKDGKGLVFATPAATAKYRNMMRDAKVSILIDSRENSQRDYLGAEAVTISGRAREVRTVPRKAELVKLLVNKHRELNGFVAASTTALIFVGISRCVHVSRFQTVTLWRPKQ